MKVTCRQCKKIYDIPDSRLPQGKKIAFPCQKCQALIEIDLRPHAERFGGATGGTSPPTTETVMKPLQAAKEKRRLTGDALKKVILSKVHKLPAMPEVVVKSMQIVKQPDATFKQISDVLQTDQAITIGVLKVANSAYYGQMGEIASVQGAAVVLGLKTIVDLISIVGTSKLLKIHLAGYGLKGDYMWKHALATGFSAKILAKENKDVDEHDAFTAGLIHDVGKIVLDKYIVDWKEEFDGYCQANRQMSHLAEKRFLGFDHGEIASDLFRIWNIPPEIREGVRFHHDPDKFKKKMACIINAADLIAKRTSIEPQHQEAFMETDRTAFTQLEINESDIAFIVEEVETAVKEIMV